MPELSTTIKELHAKRLIFICASVIGAFTALFILQRWYFDPYRAQMRPVYSLIERGEQGWADDATNHIHQMIANWPVQNELADRLLMESDGSLVAEGMLIAVKHRHPRVREILQSHLNDSRWNWHLSNNNEMARALLDYLDGKPVRSWVHSWIDGTP